MNISKQQIAMILLETGSLKFGDFTLKSGMKSPVYIDLRIFVSFPKELKIIGQAYAQVLQNLTYDRLAAIPYAALPLCCSASQATGKPWLYTRKEVKQHGIKKPVEGLYQSGETVVLIDDMITTGLSKIEAVAPLEALGLKIKDIVVLVDREQGGRQQLAKKGYTLHSVLGFYELLELAYKNKKIDKNKYEETIKFLNSTKV